MSTRNDESFCGGSDYEVEELIRMSFLIENPRFEYGGMLGAYMEVVPIEKDGNCLFRSISAGLYGTQDHHLRLRYQAVGFIIGRWQRFVESIWDTYGDVRGLGPEDYRKYMCRERIWASTLEARALAESLCCTIVVWCKTEGDVRIINGPFEYGIPVIHLHYVNGNHYELFVYNENYDAVPTVVDNAIVQSSLSTQNIGIESSDVCSSGQTVAELIQSSVDVVYRKTDYKGQYASDMSIVDVEPDGNCLFRCISRGYYGTENQHVLLRQLAVKHVCDNWMAVRDSVWATFADLRGKGACEYSEYMCKLGVWGSTIEAKWLADLMDCTIVVWSRNDGCTYIVNGPFEHGPLTIHLLHVNQVHFQLLACAMSTVEQCSMRVFVEEVNDSSEDEKCKSYASRGKRRRAIVDFEKEEAVDMLVYNDIDDSDDDNDGSIAACHRVVCLSERSLKTRKLLTCQNFDEKYDVGPEYICCCCEQLFFVETVTRINKELLERLEAFYDEYDGLSYRLSNDGYMYICRTCYDHFKRKDISVWAACNGMRCNKVPGYVADLTLLEERLVALRNPFVWMVKMPRGSEYGIRGNIINIPNSLDKVVTVLPRDCETGETITVKLKRKLAYKQHVMRSNVRPKHVHDALEYLQTTFLYRRAGYSNLYNRMQNRLHTKRQDTENVEVDTTLETISSCSDSSNSDDDETTKHITLLNDLDNGRQLENSKKVKGVLCLAPGENTTMLSMYKDEWCEEMAYPTLFGGYGRQYGCYKSSSYSQVVKHELRRVDNRFRRHIENLLYKFRRVQMQRIHQAAHIVIRKTRFLKAGVTCKDVLGKDEMIISNNLGYRHLNLLRNCPEYWQAFRKDVFAMLRQLPLPTFFITLSMADLHWYGLLKALVFAAEQRHLSVEEYNTMEKKTKVEYIRDDPVTCVRFYSRRINGFLKLIQNDESILGKIIDYALRHEFQMRSKPHMHGLFFGQSPKYMVDSDETVIAYIDTYITCDSQLLPEHLISMQRHKHTKTCFRKRQCFCRFHFPRFPMPFTEILVPYKECEFVLEHNSVLKNRLITICQVLGTLPNGCNLTFGEFLNLVQLTYAEYKQALQCTISIPTVFLKRHVRDVNINNYNVALLNTWRANMDIQFILEPYGCATYVGSYMSKHEKETDKVLQAIYAEAKHKSSLKEAVESIGKRFITTQNVGAEEAAFFCLGLPYVQCSRITKWVNTNIPSERTILLKSAGHLASLQPDDEDVFMNNVHKYYSARNQEAKGICLAEFVVYYDRSKGRPLEYPLTFAVTMELANRTIVISEGVEFRRRRRPAILCFPHVVLNKDSEAFYHQKILLYLPWTTETFLTTSCPTYEQVFLNNYEIINDNMKQYEKNGIDWEELQKQANELVKKGDEKFNETTTWQSTDVIKDNGISSIVGNTIERYRVEMPVTLMSNDDFRQQMLSMADEQLGFINEIALRLKTKTVPFHLFLSGGAGTGKSAVVRMLFQYLQRKFQPTMKGDVNDNPIVTLVLSFTGSAAFNVGGTTIHSALKLPINQKEAYTRLDMATECSLREQLKDLMLLIFDEISMTGCRLLYRVDRRFRDIRQVDKPFGGLPVLYVGDLFQLQPVKDAYCFETFKTENNLPIVNIWEAYVQLFELKECHRQKDQAEFVARLNRLREGLHTTDDVVYFKSKVIQYVDYKLPHLFPTRAAVAKHNFDYFIIQPEQQRIVITCKDAYVCVLNETERIYYDEHKPENIQKTKGLHSVLQVFIGCCVEVTSNVDKSDGLTNGAFGILKNITFVNMEPTILWVLFAKKEVGLKLRKAYATRFKCYVELGYTPVFKVLETFTITSNTDSEVQRLQFPVTNASARTIHHVQGDSLEDGVVNTQLNRWRPHHIQYVALSRYTSEKNVKILYEFNEKHIHVSEKVVAEMKRLRDVSAIHITRVDIHRNVVPNMCRIVLHNCRDYTVNRYCIARELKYCKPTFIILTEICTSRLDIDDYKCYASFDGTSQGVCIAIHNSVRTLHVVRIAHTFIAVETLHFTVCGVYLSPNNRGVGNDRDLDLIQTYIQRRIKKPNHTVICGGDFNFVPESTAMLRQWQSRWQAMLVRLKLQYIDTDDTTDYDSVLDHLYYRSDNISLKCIYNAPSFWSDHHFLVYDQCISAV